MTGPSGVDSVLLALICCPNAEDLWVNVPTHWLAALVNAPGRWRGECLFSSTRPSRPGAPTPSGSGEAPPHRYEHCLARRTAAARSARPSLGRARRRAAHRLCPGQPSVGGPLYVGTGRSASWKASGQPTEIGRTGWSGLHAYQRCRVPECQRRDAPHRAPTRGLSHPTWRP